MTGYARHIRAGRLIVTSERPKARAGECSAVVRRMAAGRLSGEGRVTTRSGPCNETSHRVPAASDLHGEPLEVEAGCCGVRAGGLREAPIFRSAPQSLASPMMVCRSGHAFTHTCPRDGTCPDGSQEPVRVMMSLLRKRHNGPYARKSSSNGPYYSPRICAHLFSPCHFLVTAPITRTGS